MSQITSNATVCSRAFQATNTDNTTAPRGIPLVHRWKGQWCGKGFCIMVSWAYIAIKYHWSVSSTFLGKQTRKFLLTQWGRATRICVGKLTNIGSDNGLSPSRRQAIIWTNAGILLIGPLGTNFSEILIGIQTFSFKKMHLKMSSAKWRLFVSAAMC